MHNSGKTIIIESGNYHAKIVSVGAGLSELTLNGYHLVIPHNPESIPLAHLGKILLPWPNRLAFGHYVFDNKEYQLPINDITSQSSIHGLTAWKEWEIVDLKSDSVSLETFVIPIYGYPFLIRASVTYKINADNGLSIAIKAENFSETEAPYGAGIHPYLTCNLNKIDSCLFTCQSEQVFTVDKNLYPLELVDAKKLGLNFIEPRVLENIYIDHTFKSNNSNWIVSLMNEDISVFMCSDSQWIQIYTGEKLNRLGVAVEPMTCPPNSFNSNFDLIRLKPRDSYTMHLRIYARLR